MMIELGTIKVLAALEALNLETAPFAQTPPCVDLIRSLQYMLGYQKAEDGVESFPAEAMALVRAALERVLVQTVLAEDRLIA